MEKTPQSLTFEESRRLTSELLSPKSKPRRHCYRLRDYAMAMILLEAGLRVGELVRLRCSHLIFLDKAKTSITLDEYIAEKGCERIIPASVALQNVIAELITDGASYHKDSQDDYVFASADKKGRISVRQVQRIIGSAAERSIGRWINPHVLRHTFATNLMKVTNIRVVQQLLGHRCLSSTQIYTHPGAEDCLTAINKVAELKGDLPAKERSVTNV